MRLILIAALALSTLAAGTFAKDITGTPEDDLIAGTPEPDRIMALEGHDDVQARGGDDIVDGRQGDDTLTGGPGRDVFAYYARDYDQAVDNGVDTITDFASAEDVILLDKFARAEVGVRLESGHTVIDLPDLARITLRGITRLDDDDLVFR
jgi:Ca2+-binding RTX toxin-like protein